MISPFLPFVFSVELNIISIVVVVFIKLLLESWKDDQRNDENKNKPL